MFMRGVRKIQASMTGRRPIPTRRLRWILRWVFGILNGLPGRRFRTNVALRFFRYAEQISIYAYQMVHDKIPRRDSLLHQIWGCHAMDESRHLAFDAMILERNRPCWAWAWIPHLLAALCSTLLSLSLNANEVWAARQLGLRVSLWQLPWLMRRTKAPFKRRVFGLLARAIMGQEAAAR